MGWLDKLLGREKRGPAEAGGMTERPQEQAGGGQPPPMPQEPPEPQAPAEGEQDRT
jgi:hypothetical protein